MLDFGTNEKLFCVMNPKGNDCFSDLDQKDLKILINLLQKSKIAIRDNLGLKQEDTFGLEIELGIKDISYGGLEKIQHVMASINNNWPCIFEAQAGIEINSPILTDTKENWDDLKNILTYVKPDVNINEYCGGHIHIGVDILGKNKTSWLNFIRIWSVYEHVIFRFLYGDFPTHRTYILQFAKPLKYDFQGDYSILKKLDLNIENIIQLIKHNRRNQAVNFYNSEVGKKAKEKYIKGTIEFRSPNSSIYPETWQNNVNFLVKLLYYASSDSFDYDKVEKRYEKDKNKYFYLLQYSNIYMEEALELIDMVFDNNLDKLYFLKQYLKDFKKYSKNKTFSKSMKY